MSKKKYFVIEKLEIFASTVVILFFIILIYFYFSQGNLKKRFKTVNLQEGINSDTIQLIKPETAKLEIIPATFSADLKFENIKYFFNSNYLAKKLELNNVPYQMTMNFNNDNSYIKQMVVVEVKDENNFLVEDNIGSYNIFTTIPDLFLVKNKESNNSNLENANDKTTILQYYSLTNKNKLSQQTPMYKSSEIKFSELKNKIAVGDYLELEINCRELCDNKDYLTAKQNQTYSINKVILYEKF